MKIKFPVSFRRKAKQQRKRKRIAKNRDKYRPLWQQSVMDGLARTLHIHQQ